MKFELTDDQIKKVQKWRAEQDAIVLARQRAAIADRGPDDSFTDGLAKAGIPYYGAIGGEITYSFIPNSIGEVVFVTHGGTKAELNLTDWDSW